MTGRVIAPALIDAASAQPALSRRAKLLNRPESGLETLPIEPGADAEDELDPRVQRFLRFLVEMAVKSLIREQEEAANQQAGERDVLAGEAAVLSTREKK
jgi:hypothetical protein